MRISINKDRQSKIIAQMLIFEISTRANSASYLNKCYVLLIHHINSQTLITVDAKEKLGFTKNVDLK